MMLNDGVPGTPYLFLMPDGIGTSEIEFAIR